MIQGFCGFPLCLTGGRGCCEGAGCMAGGGSDVSCLSANQNENQ